MAKLAASEAATFCSHLVRKITLSDLCYFASPAANGVAIYNHSCYMYTLTNVLTAQLLCSSFCAVWICCNSCMSKSDVFIIGLNPLSRFLMRMSIRYSYNQLLLIAIWCAGYPDSRWHGLRHWHAGWAALPWRENHRDLRGDKRDPTTRHRGRAYQGISSALIIKPGVFVSDIVISYCFGNVFARFGFDYLLVSFSKLLRYFSDLCCYLVGL